LLYATPTFKTPEMGMTNYGGCIKRVQHSSNTCLICTPPPLWPSQAVRFIGAVSAPVSIISELEKARPTFRVGRKSHCSQRF